ncbi:hypothetical protein IAQ61_002696 [Plenodomus lingam]|uniref:uncharacterized protein n=1 Tax=Leptosphaeria maculans TaxID=5022 RepID=UPI00331E4DB8|nr:hypothetical protein IAQ61_002696 [Plenodomus lingam]
MRISFVTASEDRESSRGMGRSPKRRCTTAGQAYDMKAKLDSKPYDYTTIGSSVQTPGFILDHAQNPSKTRTLREYCGVPGPRPFPFFDLPQEIRDLVYSHLVVYSKSEAVIRATMILKNQQKRITAKATRERLNRQRSASGARLARCRPKVNELSLYLNLLLASRRMYAEASDYFYSKNCFHISLNKLPSTAFDAPYGWDLTRIKKLQVDLQVKDAIRMDRYVDWRAFLSPFSSLQHLRIEPTFHPRYYEWAYPELSNWSTTHYVHKAFFRELLAAIPYHVSLKVGAPPDLTREKEEKDLITTRRIDNRLLYDMYTEFEYRANHGPASSVVDSGRGTMRTTRPHLRPTAMGLGPYCP